MLLEEVRFLLSEQGLNPSLGRTYKRALICLPFAWNWVYFIHFEIIGDPCNLIGSQQCDLFMNRTCFCSKSHHFPNQRGENIREENNQSDWKKHWYDLSTNRVILCFRLIASFSVLHSRKMRFKAFPLPLFNKPATGSINFKQRSNSCDQIVPVQKDMKRGAIIKYISFFHICDFRPSCTPLRSMTITPL